ncbi:MAG: hypothetical protein CSB24_06660 [Deltaproteobacteria bacterium]|nr:MAG: hypothetical protein CSB24_06660 [Deltaproteobacteria bacterium]
MTDKIEIKEPPVLFKKTQEVITKIEHILGSPLITYWSTDRGSVCGDDVVAFYELLESIGKQDTLYFFIKSSGGNGEASLRIINLLRQYCEKLVALIPLECASAATMMAIGSNRIIMGPMAYLTSVDTSLTHELSPIDQRDNRKVGVSLDELNRVIRLWNKEKNNSASNPYTELYQYIHPLVIGAVDRADSLSVMICEELLSYHMKDEKIIKEISNILNSKYPSHSYPILKREAERIGLNVAEMKSDVHSLLLELNELYSEMGQEATTDYSENKSHSNEILNILEVAGMQVYYQTNKEWFYRVEERRWVTMNDNSNWRKITRDGSDIVQSILHIK